MAKPMLSLDTLNLRQSPAREARFITPLPSPSDLSAFSTDGGTPTPGGKRTHDFFDSPVQVQPPAKIDLLSPLPSAIQSSPPRLRKTVPSSLGLGDSPVRRSVSLKVSGHGLPLDPPSRMPSLLPSIDRSASRSVTLASAGEDWDDLEPGHALNDYTIVKRLGTGAFSKVVLARQQGQATAVAVKVIDRQTIERNDRMRISVSREVEVLKHIRHPSLIHLVTAFDLPRYTCLVLEYAEGGELFDLVTKEHASFTEAFARRIFGELADVLGWMHSIGLVHRDIKLESG
jgi:hypothetical protein